tara:strand:- start:966 stop:1124 length:159 start_codon:yes stop_codon:yes gene_type:complete
MIETDITTKNKSNIVNPIIIVVTNVINEIFEIKIEKITFVLNEITFFVIIKK